jgi:GNAT superfamily N-acetyltransferase
MRLKMPFMSVTDFHSIQPVPMTPAHLPAVMHVEQSAYFTPVDTRQFLRLHRLRATTCLSGFKTITCWAIWWPCKARMSCICSTSPVAPGFQRRGWGHLLQTLMAWSRERGVHAIWLEVRASNHAAIALYQAHGFRSESA